MVCISCAARVKSTVESIDGVSDVEMLLAERSVRVTYAPGRLSPDRLVAAIDAFGFIAGAPVYAQ